jgi:hypothetical protein
MVGSAERGAVSGMCGGTIELQTVLHPLGRADRLAYPSFRFHPAALDG